MCPQPDPREPENGVNPASGKIQNITPEWQTEQKTLVDSAVARVKGKHHDGDVLSWTAFAVKSGGTANLFVLCGWKGFSFYKIKAEKPHHHIFIQKRKQKNAPRNIKS